MLFLKTTSKQLVWASLSVCFSRTRSIPVMAGPLKGKHVYGEYQNIGDKYRNVVGIFMNQILQGKPMTIFSDGNQQRVPASDLLKNDVEGAEVLVL